MSEYETSVRRDRDGVEHVRPRKRKTFEERFGDLSKFRSARVFGGENTLEPLRRPIGEYMWDEFSSLSIDQFERKVRRDYKNKPIQVLFTGGGLTGMEGRFIPKKFNEFNLKGENGEDLTMLERAVQELNDRLTEKDAEIDKLTRELDLQKKMIISGPIADGEAANEAYEQDEMSLPFFLNKLQHKLGPLGDGARSAIEQGLQKMGFDLTSKVMDFLTPPAAHAGATRQTVNKSTSSNVADNPYIFEINKDDMNEQTTQPTPAETAPDAPITNAPKGANDEFDSVQIYPDVPTEIVNLINDIDWNASRPSAKMIATLALGGIAFATPPTAADMMNYFMRGKSAEMFGIVFRPNNEILITEDETTSKAI